jgi:hypothetical protein
MKRTSSTRRLARMPRSAAASVATSALSTNSARKGATYSEKGAG